MDEHQFKQKFTELMDRIKDLPEEERIRLQRLARDTRKRRERLQGSINELQDSLDHLRLTVKYLVFDLEATRRENAHLRRMLNEASSRPDAEQQESDDSNFLDDADD